MSLGAPAIPRHISPMQTNIFISGGGVAGLTAAAAFGNAGFTVTLAEPAQPITTRESEGADLRTTAFLQPARDLLTEAGLWPALAPHDRRRGRSK
jgi:2-octaprenyl-6-methoxyphenol hydroxylase